MTKPPFRRPTLDTRRPTPSSTPRWLTQLLQWFSIHQRPMPWRDDPSPYKVWISEIMLQQTRVTAVIPYFERFLAAFPDVQTLANAPQENVLKIWEGLGYYSRARNLHAAAKIISFERNGQFPDTEKDWHTLPGVGPYTAAAVASIACGKTAAAIDGNVMRVWSRMRGIQEDISTSVWRDKARQDLVRYARKCNPSLFNQAMMELGALVCLPRNPACSACPLQRACVAHRTKRTDIIPFRKKAAVIPHRHEVVLIVTFETSNKTPRTKNPRREVHILLRQRPHTGLLAGLWEFPSLEMTSHKMAFSRKARELAKHLGVPSEVKLVKSTTVEHAFTHFSQTLHVFQTKLSSPIPLPSTDHRWCTPSDLENLPLSRSQRRIVNHYKSTS